MSELRASWTNERVAELRRLWGEGYPASYIASRLGGVSRNGVIGKLHRLGLTGRIVQTTPKPKPKVATPGSFKGRTPDFESGDAGSNPAPGTTPKESPPPAFKAEPLPTEPAPLRPGITLEELKPRSCRWPQGDPNKASFRYCGARTEVAGDSYCKAHADIAFPDRGKPRKRKSRVWNSEFLTKLQRFKDSGQTQADAAKMLGTSEKAVGAAARKYLGGWAS